MRLWQNPKIVFTLLAIFLCGAAAGASVMRLTFSPERHRGGMYWYPATRQASLEFFTEKLNLTPEQEHEMSSVLDDFMTYYQTLQAQMDDVRATGKQRIMKILNEDQKQRFEKILETYQSKSIK